MGRLTSTCRTFSGAVTDNGGRPTTFWPKNCRPSAFDSTSGSPDSGGAFDDSGCQTFRVAKSVSATSISDSNKSTRHQRASNGSRLGLCFPIIYQF